MIFPPYPPYRETVIVDREVPSDQPWFEEREALIEKEREAIINGIVAFEKERAEKNVKKAFYDFYCLEQLLIWLQTEQQRFLKQRSEPNKTANHAQLAVLHRVIRELKRVILKRNRFYQSLLCT